MRSIGTRPAPRSMRATEVSAHEARARLRRDAAGELERALPQRRARRAGSRVGSARAQHLGGSRRPRPAATGAALDRGRAATAGALVPGRVGRQDQGRDLAGRGARRGDRRGAVGGDGFGIGRGAHPGRRPVLRRAFDVGGERRVVAAMIGRVVADDVDDRRARAARVVQIGEPVARGRARDAASVAAGLVRHPAHSRRPRRSPRPRTGRGCSASPRPGRARRRNAFPTCRDW